MHHDSRRRGASKTVVWVVIAVGAGLLLCLLSGLIVRSIAGPALDAMKVSRNSANQLKSQTQAMQIAMCQAIARGEFGDQPITFERLIAENYMTAELLVSPFGPVADGGRDYWMHPAPPALDAIEDPSRVVVAYDRAMYRNHTHVSLAYLDGSGGLLEVAAFDALLAAPPNGDVDYDLPRE